jgi:hypothetical protein
MTSAAASEDEPQQETNLGAAQRQFLDRLSSRFAIMTAISAIGAVSECLRLYIDDLNNDNVVSAIMTNIFGATSFVVVPLIWISLFGGTIGRFRWKSLWLTASFPFIIYLPVEIGFLIYRVKKCSEMPGCGM